MAYPYYNPAPQVYPYLGLPPTPHGSNSDEYSTSPPVRAHFYVVNPYGSPILTQRQDATSSDFQNFDAYNQQFQNGLVKPPTPLSQNLDHKPAIGNGLSNTFDANLDPQNNTQQGSNSDDDENKTPAQSRRKAQNRAA
jgi:AP-1-like factor